RCHTPSSPLFPYTTLFRSWAQSGRVYGYRKLRDDMCDLGETCSENRVARLARLAGITAQIGYKRRPGSYGGRPAIVVENTLDRQDRKSTRLNSSHVKISYA